MNLDEMIAVLQAAKGGKTIQMLDIEGEWADLAVVTFNDYPMYRYRIKPAEKKRVPHWPAIIPNMDEQGYWVTTEIFPSLEHARTQFKAVIRLATELPPIMLEVE